MSELVVCHALVPAGRGPVHRLRGALGISLVVGLLLASTMAACSIGQTQPSTTPLAGCVVVEPLRAAFTDLEAAVTAIRVGDTALAATKGSAAKAGAEAVHEQANGLGAPASDEIGFRALVNSADQGIDLLGDFLADPANSVVDKKETADRIGNLVASSMASIDGICLGTSRWRSALPRPALATFGASNRSTTLPVRPFAQLLHRGRASSSAGSSGSRLCPGVFKRPRVDDYDLELALGRGSLRLTAVPLRHLGRSRPAGPRGHRQRFRLAWTPSRQGEPRDTA